MFERLVAAGMAVATVDYRLLQDAPLSACVHDCVAAVRYLRHHAAELGLDPGRVGVSGASPPWIVGLFASGDLSAAFGGDPGQATALSPVTQVHTDAPPVLLMHGRADGLVPVRESQRLHAALVSVGVDSTLEVTDGADHCFVGTPVEPHLDRAVTFLAAHL